MSKSKRPIVGDIVHYTSTAGVLGVHNAALVIGMPDEGTSINLAVFSDGVFYGAGPQYKPAVPYSEEPQPHTWHWPERA